MPATFTGIARSSLFIERPLQVFHVHLLNARYEASLAAPRHENHDPNEGEHDNQSIDQHERPGPFFLRQGPYGLAVTNHPQLRHL
jgi:hypothetical protein